MARKRAQNKLTQRVTSYDVAKAAGVSQATVSRTFSTGGYVAMATKNRVLAVAKRLGYAPNAFVRTPEQ